jgi:hypothetical protein
VRARLAAARTVTLNTSLQSGDTSRAPSCAFRPFHLPAPLGQPSEAARLSEQYFGQPPNPHKLGIIDKNIFDLPP